MSILVLLMSLDQIHGQQMELVAGHVVYRHGDRTPIKSFPTDPVKPSDWPNGFGQLTVAGVEQHHRLGGYLRNRYGSLLSSTYSPSEIVVRSTDFDRTLMSAQSNLVGLYPVSNISSDRVPIQPIPIHTESASSDFLLGQNSCPRYDQIEVEIDQSEDFQKANEFYASFFRKLEAWTNMTNITLFNAWDVADTIYVEHIYNKTPAWADDAVRQNLSDINDLGFYYLFKSNDSQRIRGGPVVQDIWRNMDSLVHGRAAPKVKVYSAHDTTVSAVLSFLGINYPHQPKYASALFVDLYKQNSTYFVQVEYLNVTDSNISYPYVLNGCPASRCPLSTFTSIYQARFPASAEVECAKKDPMPPMPDGDNGHLILILVIAIIGLVTVICVTFWCLHLRRTARDPPLLGIDRRLQSA